MNCEQNKFKKVNPITVPQKRSNKFYSSSEWKKCRDAFLKDKELCCSKCGFNEKIRSQYIEERKIRLEYANSGRAEYHLLSIEKIEEKIKNKEKLTESEGYIFRDDEYIKCRWNVDHILPIRRYWEYRLNPINFQILCSVCNKEKGNKTCEYVAVDLLKKLNARVLVKKPKLEMILIKKCECEFK